MCAAKGLVKFIVDCTIRLYPYILLRMWFISTT